MPMKLEPCTTEPDKRESKPTASSFVFQRENVYYTHVQFTEGQPSELALHGATTEEEAVTAARILQGIQRLL